MSAPERPIARRLGSGEMLRAVPGTADEWVEVAGRIGGLLLAMGEAEADGHTLPEPLRGRVALRAWVRLRTAIFTAVRAAESGPVLVRVSIADVDLLGATARALGGILCRYRVHSTGGEVAGALIREARAQEVTQERLVAQVARVHGVLDVDPLPAQPHLDLARDIWDAGA